MIRLFPLMLFLAGSVTAQITTGGSGSGGGSLPTLEATFPSTLMADYQMLSTETPAALVDYSGKGRNATGTIGVAPTIIPVSGGISCPGTGAVVLPAALNSALTILAYIDFQSTNYPSQGSPNVSTIVGGGTLATSSNWVLWQNNPSESAGNEIQGGHRIRTIATSAGNIHSGSSMAFNGSGVLAVTFGATDVIYVNGLPVNSTAFGGSSAGQQTVGPYNICGTSITGYFNGNIRQMAFFSTVLNAAQVASATQIMQNQMAARGVTAFLGGTSTDTNDQCVMIGDSLTAGVNWPVSLLNFPCNIADQGLGGFTTANFLTIQPDADGLYRPGALRNALTYWAGTNNLSNPTGAVANMRSFLQNRHNVGFRTVVGTMISRTGAEAYRDSLNPLLLQNWPGFADGVISFSANVRFGSDGANSNTTYYNVDGVHLTTYSDAYIIGPYLIHGVNRLYGNTLLSGNYNRYSGTGFSIPLPMQTADSGCTNLSGATVVCATPFNVTAGNFLFATIDCENCTGVTINVPTGGGTWNAVSAQGSQASAVQRSFYLMNATGGATTLSETFTGGTPANVYIKISEFAGIATAGALDVASAWAVGASTSQASAAVTTTQTGDLLITAGGPSGILGGSFYPNRGTLWNAQTGATQLTSDFNAYIAYLVTGAAGSYTGSSTTNLSIGWLFQTAAFKTVAGASTYKIQDVDIYSTCVPNGANNVGLNLPDGAWMAGETVTIHNEQASGSATCTVNGITPYETGVAQLIDGASNLLIPNGGTVELKSALTFTGVAGVNQSPVVNWSQVKSNGIPATNNNCTSSASPAVCGSASGGVFTLPAAATSVTVNTTAVTANSLILVFNDDSLGTRLGVTCNTGIDNVLVSAKTAGTSFTITGSAPVTNPNCYSFVVIN